MKDLLEKTMKRMTDKEIDTHIANAYNTVHPADLARWQKVIFQTEDGQRLMEFLKCFDETIRSFVSFELLISNSGYALRVPEANTRKINKLTKQVNESGWKKTNLRVVESK